MILNRRLVRNVELIRPAYIISPQYTRTHYVLMKTNGQTKHLDIYLRTMDFRVIILGVNIVTVLPISKAANVKPCIFLSLAISTSIYCEIRFRLKFMRLKCDFFAAIACADPVGDRGPDPPEKSQKYRVP